VTKPEAEPSAPVEWEVTYLLNDGVMASRTVKAKSKEAARELADRQVSPKRRILADEVRVEPVGE